MTSYSTSICPFESVKYGKEGKKLQKFKIWEKYQTQALKVVFATFLLIYIVYIKESTCETRKNVF